AGAFGLATPTGTSVTGMPAAQTFEGGIRGYSSAPLFEQAQAELARRRPAQKSYIDSFFIDPITGTYGANAPALIDYTAYGTGGGAGGGAGGGGSASGGRDPYGGGDSVTDFLDPNNRFGLAEHMARQQKNYAAGVSEGALGFAKTPDGGVYAVGYQPGQMSPREAAERGFTMTDKNPFDMTFGEHMSAMAGDVGNMATQLASDVSKISPIANIIKAVSKPKPKPKPKPKRNDNNNSRISIPRPKPRPKPKPKPKPKRKTGGSRGFTRKTTTRRGGGGGR
ncbi:MAG: hypothetical protein VW715_14885, partial [Rhodospirillales bacterium]